MYNASNASFRDPSGFLFEKKGKLYRQINQSYKRDYELLMSSGLYQILVDKGQLISHEEVNVKPKNSDIAYKIIEPTLVPYISYPYEWSFNQLKSAALQTLNIQRCAMKHGLSLKDASAYNIQFVDGKPLLIDTLSFEIYQEGKPWVAYRQFCQHFLATLALMSKVDIRFGQLSRIYIDGIPLDFASKLLPLSTHLNIKLKMHIHMHASAQEKYADRAIQKSDKRPYLGRNLFEVLVESLHSTIKSLSWEPIGTEWACYYDETNYSDDAFAKKREAVKSLIRKVKPKLVWDIGANSGFFSKVAVEEGAQVISYDIDPCAVDKNYLDCKIQKEKNFLPLILDLTNPSPSLGWANSERMSFLQRGPADMVLALALVHHLAISNNVPLIRLAEFFKQCGNWLIIEFVPKEDSQVQLLLTTREDIFDHYNKKDFEESFSTIFDIRESISIQGTKRTLYLMKTN